MFVVNSIIEWGKIGQDLLNKYTHKINDIKSLSISERKFKYQSLDTMKELECSGRLKLARFDKAYEYLKNNCGIRIGHMQEKLFLAIRTIFLPLMFESDLVSNIQYLSKLHGIKKIFNMFAALYPRREGKTVITTIAAAIFMVSQPYGNVICYNLAKRQADGWMNQLQEYLAFFKNSKEFGWVEIDKTGKESYTIRANATGTHNTANSYPCGLTDGKINTIYTPFKKKYFFFFTPREKEREREREKASFIFIKLHIFEYQLF